MSFYDQQFVKGDYYLHSSFSYYTTFVSRDLKYDCHPEVEIMGVVNGECVIPMEKENITLKTGEAILIDYNVQHGLLIKKSCKMYCIKFCFQKEPGFIRFRDMAQNDSSLKRLLSNPKSYFVFKDHENIASTIKRLNRVGRVDKGYYHDLLIAETIFKLANCVSGDSEYMSIGSYNVKRAMEFMSNHIEKGITVKDTAEYLGLDHSYFGRLFKKHTGMLPIDYLNHCRINKAKILLEDTDVPIVEICDHIGISTRQYFTYLFSKHEGITPSKYRKTMTQMRNKKI